MTKDNNIRELITHIVQSTKNLIDENKELKQKLYDSQKIIADLQATLSKYQEEYDKINTDISNYTQQIEELKNIKEAHEQEITNLNAELKGIKLELENFKSQNFVISEEERQLIKVQLQQVIQEIDKLVD